MKLAKFVNDVPGLRIARRDDNRRILDFYNSITMSGGAFNIRFDKEPDYFKFLEYESDRHWVLYYGNDEGHIDGMMYLNIRPCYINGKKDHVGHCADFRFRRKRDRKIKLDWGATFSRLFSISSDIDEFKGCKYFLGSYVESNEYAKKAFNDQNGPFRISTISSYQMVNILARKPMKLLAKNKPSTKNMNISISIGDPQDIPELKEFLDRQNRRRTFGFVFGVDWGELERRLETWDGFSISSFYIARDFSNTIIGCIAPWSTSKGRRIIVDEYPEFLQKLGNVLEVFGKNVPAVGQELEILYITHMEFEHSLSRRDRQYVFGALLDTIYSSGVIKNYHMLAYCDYNNETFLPSVEKDYFLQKTPTVLYQVFPKSFEFEVVHENKQEVHIGHEMCLT